MPVKGGGGGGGGVHVPSAGTDRAMHQGCFSSSVTEPNVDVVSGRPCLILPKTYCQTRWVFVWVGVSGTVIMLLLFLCFFYCNYLLGTCVIVKVKELRN